MSYSLEACIKKGQEWLRAGRYPEAIVQFRRCRVGTERNLGLAEALLGDASDRQALLESYRLLVREFFRDRPDAPSNYRDRALRLLSRVASRLDPQLAELIKDKEAPRIDQEQALYILKAFYFGGGAGSLTCGERVQIAMRQLKGRMRRIRTLLPEHYTLECAKQYASFTVLQDLAPEPSGGGGYFLNLGGYGCVVDPGHDFLANFYLLRRSLYDIDCVIVTHFHDDHYADLPALLSLLHQRVRARPKGRPVRILADETTHRMFGPLLCASDYIEKPPVILRPRSSKPIILTADIVLRTLPTRHPVLDECTGVGLDFEILPRGCHLVITGDTSWTPSVSNAYRKLREKNVVLVAHVSSARSEEIVGTLTKGRYVFYDKHLCVHGLCRAIEEIRPKRLILSEIGEELEDVLSDLSQLIYRVYGVPTLIGNRDAGPCYL